MMETTIGTPEDGMIIVSTYQDKVFVRVRWPFDRMTGEWITLAVTLPVGAKFMNVEGPSVSRIGQGEQKIEAFRPPDSGEVLITFTGRNTLGAAMADIRVPPGHFDQIIQALNEAGKSDPTSGK